MDAENILVIHGANDGLFDVAGESVGTVQVSLTDAFNIPTEAKAFVNGEQVEGSYRLKGNETLEFCKQEGEKGGSSFIRYPGGKWNHRRPIIESLEPFLKANIQYREPFFGGGGIGLELLQSGLISSVWINDKDTAMAALWTAVIRYPGDLQSLVMSFVPSPNAFHDFRRELRCLNGIPARREEQVKYGFMKLALHQMSFSGLGLKSGGPLTDIDSRWSPKHICGKIDSIQRDFSSVSVKGNACSSLDFEHLIDDDNGLLYLDPPYYKQGAALYKYAFSAHDHERLAALLYRRTAPWLLSYDDCPEIRSLYGWARIENVPVNYSITSARIRNELLISPRR